MVNKSLMLIADDMEINRDVLREMFRVDFDILEAENGRECIELVKQYKDEIKIILLDLMMPVMTGLEVLEYRKSDAVFLGIPVIVITVNDEIRKQMIAFQLGATDYITKPFIREIVIYRINNVLSSKKRVEEIVREKENLQIKAELDQMTGLYNKSTVEKVISEKLAGNNRLNALLVIDIDDFKQVNDVFGHLQGDHTIRILADLISGHFRKTDIIGRAGGDEFVVFMEDLPSPSVAVRKADELAKLLRYKPNLTVPANVSVSIGLAMTKSRPYSYRELFEMADEALYYAKENGKGRFSMYGMQQVEEVAEGENKTALLYSRNRDICQGIQGAADTFRVVEILSTEYTSEAEKAVLLFVDITTEPENGEKLLQQIQETGWMKKLPVFVICKEGCMDQYALAIQYHAKDILPAPVDIKFVRKRIEALNRARQQD